MSLSSDYLIQLWHQFDRWQAQTEMLLNEIQTRANLVLAIDFSELYQYMYINEDRHQMVSHIIENVDRELTLPPGTCYELLWHANSTIGRPDEEKWRSLEKHGSVERFLQEFNQARGKAEAQMRAYQAIDESIRDALEDIASITRPESPWRKITELLGAESLRPLGNFVEVSKIKLDLDIEEGVRNTLGAHRGAHLDLNTMIDSLNFAVTYACNEWQHSTKTPKIQDAHYAVFTGSTLVANVYARYPWERQEIVRRAEYLKIMANLNKNVPRGEQTTYLKNCIELIKDLKTLIVTQLGQLGIHVGKLETGRGSKPIKLPIEVIDKFKQFEDEYYFPLFSLELKEAQAEWDRARELYNMMSEQDEFSSAIDNAYSVISIFFDRINHFLEHFELEGDLREQVRETLKKLSGNVDTETTDESEVEKT